MNHKTGFITKTINGEVRCFHFSINAWILFCELHKIAGVGIPDAKGKKGISELGEFLSDSKNQLIASRDLLYCAALAHCRENGIEENFNRYTAGIWYDSLTVKDYQDIESVMMECSFLQGGKKKR